MQHNTAQQKNMSTGTIDYDRSDDPNPMWKYNKYSTTKYNTARHNTMQRNAMQYNTIYTCFSLWLVVLTGS